MTILAVDDEPIALDALCRTIQETLPGCTLFSFTDPWVALEKIGGGKFYPDVAFLDVEMFDLTGLELAKRLKDLYPAVNIVFVTGYAEYMGEAFHLHASGYVLKPAKPESIRRELDDLRNPVKWGDDGRLRIQCFGDFEVFFHDQPLKFSRSKTKELLAYLVNRRGAVCTVREIAAVLWEDKPDSGSLQSHLRLLVTDLRRTLKVAGVPNVLYKRRGCLAILPDAISCDYYKFIQGDVRVINSYMGEYMAQYSWAEFVTAYLERH